MARQRRGEPCNSAAIVPDGYRFHTASRPAQKRGGGVAVIYKSGLKVENESTRNNSRILSMLITKLWHAALRSDWE